MKKRSARAKTFQFNTWRDFPPMNTSVGTMLHNKTGTWRYIKPLYEDKTPPCQNACPSGNDIEGWIKLLQKGELEKAYWHLKREEPFPAVLGRVCFKFCETPCNRSVLDESISIKELERFVGDQIDLSTCHPDLPDPNGKSLAVVGSGPAGMSAAYYARLLGFEVTIFEALPIMGGILRIGIPAYRLPREIVAAEFEGLKNMGVSMRPNCSLGRDLSLHELRETFDYIFLGTGVHQSMNLKVRGEQGRGVMSGLSLLKKVSTGEAVSLGKKTIVVGGGNTAIDAARTAIRLGCEVTVLYRRSESEMPAHPEEVEEARQEGVRFRFLAAPERIDLDGDDRVNKLICSEMTLGPPDDSGRRRPVKKKDALFALEVDSVLTAVGEMALLDYLKGTVETERGILPVDELLRIRADGPGRAKIFAGGDIIDAPHTVVHAVAAGKRAAIAMDCDRTGKDASEVLGDIAVGTGGALSFSRYMGWRPVNPVRQNLSDVVGSDRIVYDYFERAPRVKSEGIKPVLRKGSFETYTKTLDRDEAEQEAARCIHCGRCTECDNCLIFCPDVSVLCKEEGYFGYAFDYDYCKGCGICFTECPRSAITMVDEAFPIEEED